MGRLFRRLMLGDYGQYRDIQAYETFFVMNFIMLASVLVSALFGVYCLLAIRSVELFVLLMLCTAIFVLGVYLNRIGKRKVCTAMLTLMVALVSVYLVLMVGWSPGLVWFIVVALLPQFLVSDISPRRRLSMTVFGLAAINACLFLHYTFKPILTIPDARQFAFVTLNAAFLSLIFEFFLVSMSSSFAARIYRQNLEHEQIISMRDPLTGLWNRRFAQEYEKTTDSVDAVAMIDIDHFKNFNDTYKHVVGDMLLAQLGTQLQQAFRKSDSLIRWGGEEFVLILLGISAKRAAEMIRDLKNRLPAFKTEDGEEIRFTFSAGIATMDRNTPLDNAVAVADTYMYKAKQNGRNCVCYLEGEDAKYLS